METLNEVFINSIVNTNSNYSVRRETYNDRPYIVVPVTMMVEGVHDGSQGPLLHLAEELGAFPNAWNGIPVTLQHPEMDGEFVSANSPDILAEYATGIVFETHLDGDKLKAEAWIEEARMRQLSPDTLAEIERGEPLEVSVGMFSADEEVSGEWNGETYNAISRNPRPDHLALLPGGVGACSLDDGCGVRANKKGGENVMKNDEKVATLSKEKHLENLLANAEAGYREVMSTIQSKLDVMDSDLKFHYLQEVYEDYFVYEVRQREGGNPPKLYKRGYSANEDGSIEFDEEPTEVRKQVSYVTFEDESLKRTKFNNKQKEVTTMSDKSDKPCCEDVVDALIANEATKFTAEDKEWLLTLKEDQIAKMVQNEASQEEDPPKEDTPPQLNAEQAMEIVKESLKTNEDFLNLMPADLREQARSGLKLHQEQKSKMVKAILDNTDEGVWTEDRLKSKEIDDLESIFKSVVNVETVADYSLNLSAETKVNQDVEEPMIPIFTVKKDETKTA
jgi:hypothetical protein